MYWILFSVLQKKTRLGTFVFQTNDVAFVWSFQWKITAIMSCLKNMPRKWKQSWLINYIFSFVWELVWSLLLKRRLFIFSSVDIVLWLVATLTSISHWTLSVLRVMVNVDTTIETDIRFQTLHIARPHTVKIRNHLKDFLIHFKGFIGSKFDISVRNFELQWQFKLKEWAKRLMGKYCLIDFRTCF